MLVAQWLPFVQVISLCDDNPCVQIGSLLETSLLNYFFKADVHLKSLGRFAMSPGIHCFVLNPYVCNKNALCCFSFILGRIVLISLGCALALAQAKSI